MVAPPPKKTYLLGPAQTLSSQKLIIFLEISDTFFPIQ